MKTYIIDTNIILNDVDNLFQLYNKTNLIIIPETVIDELDSKKSLLDEIGFQAREFARLLETMTVKSINKTIDFTETLLENSKLRLCITSRTSYNQYSDYPNIQNDRKIIEVAKLYEDGIFITLDSMCKIRAISEGIKTENIGIKSNKQAPVFLKEFEVDSTDIDNKDILSVDASYTHENYNYLFSIKDSNQKLLGRICNNKISIVDENYLNKQDIKPLNIRQKFFVDAILDDKINLVALNAAAGTGKSLLSIATALRLVKDKKFSKIVYIRNSIESIDRGEDIGYLSGNEEKLAIYNHPLYDSLEYIVRKRLEHSNENKSRKQTIDSVKIKTEVQELIQKYDITTMWIGELRGRTISDAIVIADEFQNFSAKSALLLLSRLDKDCKIVVIGSVRQIDNPYINKYNNALTILLESIRVKQNINTWAGELTNVVRGPITEFAESIFKL